MTDAASDLQADALLQVVIAREGDLRRAFAWLCAAVQPEDLRGEGFERALARAVGVLCPPPPHALARIGGPGLDRGSANDA